MNKIRQSISIDNIFDAISTTSSSAVLSQLAINNTGLRNTLKSTFQDTASERSGFLADPIIEASFGWKSAPLTMTDLAQRGTLSNSMVELLARAYAPDTAKQRKNDSRDGIERLGYTDDVNEDYTWPKDRPPYEHQLEAWEILGEEKAKSTIITSGTGSGKTECFFVPLFNDLIKQVEGSDSELNGVQAIMLYPLNALIKSQEERLIAWSRGLNGKVRYALYTGETVEHPKSQAQQRLSQRRPEFVGNRQEIREKPPQILVTNPTMLEYILIRPKDRPIIDQSKGKLKWIILDEAHTLVGTQAAEISLLLRRTMLAFDVAPEDVRFVATSATIGNAENWEQTKRELENFLANLAGVSPSQVIAVKGNRDIPKLIHEQDRSDEIDVKALESMSSADAYRALCEYPTTRNLRNALAKAPLSVKEIARKVFPGKEISINLLSETRKLLDVATNAYSQGDDGSEAFLPVRIHLFHRAQRGVWACVNPNCAHKSKDLLDDSWPFGQVYIDERRRCLPGCESIVLELTHCRCCVEPTLAGSLSSDKQGRRQLIQRDQIDLDEYEHEIEGEDEQDKSELVNSSPVNTDNIQVFSMLSKDLERYRDNGGAIQAFIDGETGLITNDEGERTIEIRYTAPDREDGLRCACCNVVEKSEGESFKRATLGSPFLMANIVPEMLRHIPRDNQDSLDGARLITFTDSRQGTARFSAKLQLESERKWCRSVIYRYVLSKASSNHELQNKILEKQTFIARDDIPEDIKGVFREELFKLEESQANQVVSWTKLQTHLAKRHEIRLMSGYDNDSSMLSGEYRDKENQFENPENIARLFLLREFARRPKNANNLETLGLTQIVYPKLADLDEDDLDSKCPAWTKDFGLNLQDWKVYLKLILDFYVRENSLVDVSPYEINWMGGKLFARLLRLRSDLEALEHQLINEKDYPHALVKSKLKAYMAYPTVNDSAVQHRLVRLLELRTQRVARDEKEIFNEVLNYAWICLVDELKLLRFVDDGEDRRGYQLQFDEAIGFAPTKDVSLCPVTSRWLDTVFGDISPYATNKTGIEDVTVRERMEHVPHPNADLLRQENSAGIREWLNTEPVIMEKRVAGLWRDVADLAMLPPQLLRSAEHSAQQETRKLESFEKAFKNDQLNVLNCSTTMEMGVDIGSLSMVAMNNAPPSTANYLQRAGRAGRRKESTSVVLTFCKANPHGERIFSQPKWPFETLIPVPKVALGSESIVRRHINAFLLAYYLNRVLPKSNLPQMQAKDFFISDTDISHVERFSSWLQNEAPTDSDIIFGVTQLCIGSSLASLNEVSLITECEHTLNKVTNHWLSRWESIANEVKLSSRDASRAVSRLKRQQGEMERESLLSVLTSRGFLPGYGFPTDVVQLSTSNKSERNGKENESRQRKYPSRSLPVAIREFAPGMDIVLNSAVYRSQGLQMSWLTADGNFEIKGKQKIRSARNCSNCGHTEIDILQEEDLILKACIDCGSNEVKQFEYIVPDGFQVDYSSPLHNDYTAPRYAPYKEPFVSLPDTDWQVLHSAELGRFKVSDFGHLFYYSDGSGAGYALCWACGRMEEVRSTNDRSGIYISDKERPALLTRETHKRLRGTSFEDSLECTNEAIKVGLTEDCRHKPSHQKVVKPFVLGADVPTSIFELQLRSPDIDVWVDDKALAYSFGAALRQVFCKAKGISTSELGLAVYNRKVDDSHAKPVVSIVLYDTASQGAGYATSIPEALSKLLPEVQKFVENCPKDCEAYCHACLLDYDTQHSVDNLDRQAVAKFLIETRYIERLKLELSRCYFDNNDNTSVSEPELNDGNQILALKARSASAIDIFISGAEWEVPAFEAIKKLRHSNAKIRLLINEDIQDNITGDLAWALTYLLHGDVKVCTFKQPQLLSSRAHPVLRLALKTGSYWYATDDMTATSLNGEWGSTQNTALVAARPLELEFDTKPFPLAELARESVLANNQAFIENIGNKVNGSFEGFGDRLLNLVSEHYSELDSDLSSGIESVTYSDRYLVSPISLGLMANLFVTLRTRYGVRDFEVYTADIAGNGSRAPYCVADNFDDIDDLFSFISAVGDGYGINIYPEVDARNAIEHRRVLEMKLRNGETLRLFFDQGMGFWSKRKPYSNKIFNYLNIDGFDLQSWNGMRVQSTGESSYIVVVKG